MLLGLIRPTAGTFALLGTEQGNQPGDEIRRVGAVMETPSFYPYLTGRQNLLFFQAIGGGGEEATVDALLELVGLSARGGSRFAGYSLGMKHRLGIAYAMLHDPDLLLLDEPTNGLDPNGMAEVRSLISNLTDGNRTIILASHLLGEVQQVCDHVAILSKGEVVVQGEGAVLIGRGDQTKIRTTDDTAVSAILGALDWVESVDATPDGLTVVADPARSWELSAALSAGGVHVAEMGRAKASLEDYFLQVTEQAPA